MKDNKKSGDPLETEGRARDEEIQKLKRSNSILSFGLFLQGVLYGTLSIGIILRINRISDILLRGWYIWTFMTLF